MQERRFDDLTRALGRASSRRQVLKGLLAGLAGVGAATLSAGPAERAAAAKSPPPRPPRYASPCDNATQAACDEQATHYQEVLVEKCESLTVASNPREAAVEIALCLANATKVGNLLHHDCSRIIPCDSARCQHCTDSGCQSDCVSPATCNGHGSCICPSGQTACNGGCPDFQTDNANCGSCGHACPAGGTCVAGVCCVGASGTCTKTSDCCFGTCHNGTCCLPDGGYCAGANDCCSGFCGADGKCFSCTPLGQSCDATTQCCTGSCFNGTCSACVPNGQPCANGDTCCTGSCVSGTCKTCLEGGMPCTGGDTCCTGSCTNGTCPCPSGQKLCSLPIPGCFDCCYTDDCPSGDTCDGGVCVPGSSTCTSGFNGKCDQAGNCACEYDYTGTVRCLQIINNCYAGNTCPPCSQASDCPSGQTCAPTGDGKTLGCVAVCNG